MAVWVIMFSFHQYQSFHIFEVLMLIKPEPCFVPASILKGLVCCACVTTLCHDTSLFASYTSKFAGFTHHDIAVHWWSSYMYYAYQSSTPSHIIEKYHLLVMNPIKGPKMRCNVPQLLEIYDAQEYLPAIDHLKNYPRNSISQSQVKESILNKKIIHISLTNDN
jgi:hypothetical protein